MIGDASLVDDRSLLSHYARTRDAQAFSELSSRYAGLVYGTCLRVTQNPEDAEDVSQECFLEMARRAGTISSSLGGWLHKVAKTRSINAIRSEVARRNREQKAFEETDNSPSTWAEVAPYIDEAVGELPDNLRLAVVLHFFHGLDQSEVARQLEVNQSTVSRQLEKAVSLLREHLKKAGILVPVTLLALLLGEHGATAAPAALTAALGKMAIAGVGGGSASALAVGIAAKQFVTSLPAKLAVGAVVLGLVGTIGYKVTGTASPVAPAPPPAPVQTPGPKTPPVVAPSAPVVHTAATPMDSYRGDPFLPAGYTKPPENTNARAPIADLPMPRIAVVTPPAGSSVALAPPPTQPARRMAGLVQNGGGIAAIVETNGKTEVVGPGEMLSDRLAMVDRIEPNKVVLKTAGNAPEYINVGLAPGIRPAPVAATPAVAQAASELAPPPAMAPAARPAVAPMVGFGARRPAGVPMVSGVAVMRRR